MDYEPVKISSLDAVETLKDSAEFLVEQDGVSQKTSFKQINDTISWGGGSEVYSTDEVCIGTWIDGKPIYRKVFEATAPESEGSKLFIDTGIKDLDKLTHIHGALYEANGNTIFFPTYSLNNDTEFFSLYFQYGTKRFMANVKGSLLLGKPCVLTIEYTKTTD